MNASAINRNGHLLVSTIACAVPLWAQRYLNHPIEYIFDAKRLTALSDRLWEAGEAVLFKSEKPGRSADGFNALAEIVATLAFCPGGVRCFGMHFEYKHGEPWASGKHGVPIEPTIASNAPAGDPASDLASVQQRLGKVRIRGGKVITE